MRQWAEFALLFGAIGASSYYYRIYEPLTRFSDQPTTRIRKDLRKRVWIASFQSGVTRVKGLERSLD
jgi:hypothetical protein